MALVSSVVILQLPVQVVQAVVLAAVLVLRHTRVAIGGRVRLVVIFVHGSVGPELLVVEGGSIREVGVRPPCRHLLLVVNEKLPCFLRKVRLPDDSLGGR